MPKEPAQARYVVLGFDFGDAFIAESAPDDSRVLPDDRENLAALRAALERWGRYDVVARPGRAELFVATRVGRQGTIGGGGHVELSSSQDMLAVYASTSRGTPLWRAQSSGGLKSSPPPLFERFRSDVERAAKTP